MHILVNNDNNDNNDPSKRDTSCLVSYSIQAQPLHHTAHLVLFVEPSAAKEAEEEEGTVFIFATSGDRTP